MKIKVNHVDSIKQFADVEFGAVFYKQDETGEFYIKITTIHDKDDYGATINAIHLETGEPNYFDSCEFVVIPHRAEMIIDL